MGRNGIILRLGKLGGRVGWALRSSGSASKIVGFVLMSISFGVVVATLLPSVDRSFFVVAKLLEASLIIAVVEDAGWWVVKGSGTRVLMVVIETVVLGGINVYFLVLVLMVLAVVFGNVDEIVVVFSTVVGDVVVYGSLLDDFVVVAVDEGK